ncbi:hypothetical protein [Mongoliitalea daihaiensis]|uniref:hypothetical protein n=1 Tax=Mongoliitalea daihaiensis TaxID=2782006 RepID=UPI001F187963|nr:hypothetical protein [Mongoliitalea daihaiensis]UJP64657.1 hypothetical protein IPZ59_17930 [Mongoliitalea daihaiensis]
MKRFLLSLSVFICLIGQVLLAQTTGINQKKPAVLFGFALEGTYRNFISGSYLADTYQINPGYQLKMTFGFEGYPGIGLFAGAQGAKILDNQFLGGFFERTRFRDSGIFIFYDIPIVEKFQVRTDIGYGALVVVHGESPQRFLLDYQHFYGNIGVKYQLLKEPQIHRVYLTGAIGSGIFRGNQLVINAFDRPYLERATDVRGSIGILLELY